MWFWGICPLFDIVNGFFNRRGDASWNDQGRLACALLQMMNLAEIIVRTYDSAGIMQV
jgi:hypothetical protein